MRKLEMVQNRKMKRSSASPSVDSKKFSCEDNFHRTIPSTLQQEKKMDSSQSSNNRVKIKKEAEDMLRENNEALIKIEEDTEKVEDTLFRTDDTEPGAADEDPTAELYTDHEIKEQQGMVIGPVVLNENVPMHTLVAKGVRDRTGHSEVKFKIGITKEDIGDTFVENGVIDNDITLREKMITEDVKGTFLGSDETEPAECGKNLTKELYTNYEIKEEEYKRCVICSKVHFTDDCLQRHMQTHTGSNEADDDEDEEDEEDELAPILVPRVLRPFYNMDDSSDEDAPPRLVVDNAWPPTRLVAATDATPRDEANAAPNPPPQPLEVAEPAATAQQPSVTPPGACFPEKFDFQWKPFPNPQIQPELRREPFSQINCGPTTPYASPYEAFIAIWDRAIMEHIVSETNKYAQQLAAAMLLQGIGPSSRITQWKDTSVDELYTYFAIILATGIVIKSRLDEYWNSSKDIFSTPEFSITMPFDRFCLLNKCLHFNDNDLCTAERMSNNETKLFKVLPIVQHLNYKFSELYVLGRNIALDESLTQWTGRLNIPNKAAAVGIKTYEICESETGYLWRFELEARQSFENTQEGNPISGKIPSLVLRLLHGLEHKGHTVWMDNYYNSPALARELKLLGFDCVGTLRTNRQLVPAELANLKAKHMTVGQVCGCTSGDVDIVVWRDKKRIALISTYHGLTTTTSHDITKPTIIHDYNICMGGVDKKDQLLAMYPIERKRTKVWYKKFFRRLLNASVLNAYIILASSRQLSHRNFRRSLVVELLERHNKYNPKVPQIAESKTHIPLFFEFERAGEGVNARRLRRKCANCSKRCITYCGGCGGKPLCLKPCFPRYHAAL